MSAAAEKYDGAFMMGPAPIDLFWTKRRFGLPTLKWFTYMPDPLFTVSNFHPFTDISTSMPLLAAVPQFLPYGPMFVLNRLTTHFSSCLINFFFYDVFFSRLRFAFDSPEVQRNYDRLMEDVVVGDGFYGMREKKQDPQNVDMVIPPMRSSSQYYKKQAMEALPDDYDQFLSK